MLTDNDIERMDSIMESVLQLREERGYMPTRDEDKIAEILQRAEKSASAEHQRLLDSELQFVSVNRHQIAVKNSDNLKSFPQVDRWRGQQD